MKQLPSTQALRALDAFARHGSVWLAADELALTRSAVSHQLRLLECDLGFPMFTRTGNRIELTPQGAAYAADIRRALQMIAGSSARHARRDVSGSITVSSAPGFASQFLSPRIAGFCEAYPEVSVTIVTPRRVDEVAVSDVDLFVAFGDGHWPGMNINLIAEVEFTPLCSPVLINRLDGLTRPDDLQRTRILHFTDQGDWTRWATLAGADPAIVKGGIVFGDMNLVMAAALAAQGVALGDNLIPRGALRSGLLVRPFDVAVKSDKSYFLVTSEEKADWPVVGAFRAWLLAQVEKDSSAPPAS